jgi:hypothetical protein
MKILFNDGESVDTRSLRVEHGYVHFDGNAYKLGRMAIENGEVVYYVEGDRRLEERQPWCLW